MKGGRIVKNILSVDGHCDTVLKAFETGTSIIKDSGKTHITLSSLSRMVPHIQFMALFCDRFNSREHFHGLWDLLDFFYMNLSSCENSPVVIIDRVSLDECIREKRLGIILAVEGAYLLEDNLHRLDMLYKLGIRCLSLTWNPGNKLCGGIGDSDSRGLGSQGARLVKKMNRLGMLIDLSHISERGFWDIIELTDRPVIASHSNCLSLCNNKRNLDDRQIKAVADKNGVIGVNFVPDFLGREREGISTVVDHIEHIVQLGGPGCAGLGSDFDGTEDLPEGITGIECFYEIYEELLKRGYSEEDAAKVMGGNMLRVIEDVIGQCR